MTPLPKLRAWDKREKDMYDDIALLNGQAIILEHHLTGYSSSEVPSEIHIDLYDIMDNLNDDYIIMTYTDVFAYNGERVCEGDRVVARLDADTTEKWIGRIVKRSDRFILRTDKGDVSLTDDRILAIHITGHIYEPLDTTGGMIE